MFQFHDLNGFLYVGDFLFLAALATIILKLQLEKSSEGFSAKTQGVYGVVLCTRNIDLLFVEGSLAYLIYSVTKKITNISCIIYIVFKIKSTSKKTITCNCNQDSFWIEALVIPCIIITAVLHCGNSPEEVLWSFSTYLEAVAMMPQLYLIHVRGKGDTYLPAYIALMAIYTLADATAYCLNAFIYKQMPAIWPACKCLQLAIYIWYIISPREAVLPVANCVERKRRTTFFMRQQSMLAQTLLTKNNSANDLQIFSLTSSATPSLCSASSLDDSHPVSVADSPPPTPCIKFDASLAPESIKLKAPITLTTIKQLKNKGRLKIVSLPASPEVSRKSELFRSPSSTDCFRPINDFTQFSTALSRRAERIRRIGASLPTTPETVRKSKSSLRRYSRSISNIDQVVISNQRRKKRAFYHSDISLQMSPELTPKDELILRASSISSYKSLSHLPMPHSSAYKLCPKRPSLPRVEGSPAFEKKTDQDLSTPSLARDDEPSPKPSKPPPPLSHKTDEKNELQHTSKESNIAANTQLEHTIIPINNTSDKTKKAQKPKRPPLPKFVISVPDDSNA